MNTAIRIVGLDKVQARLRTDLTAPLRTAAMAIAELVRNQIAQYPQSPRHPIRWASAKQRRFYFAMRKRAGLPVAYTRQFDPMSQRLGPSWTVAPHGEMGAKVATRVSYAPYVQEGAMPLPLHLRLLPFLPRGEESHPRQQPFHRDSGWMTDVQAVQNVSRSGQIKTIIERAIRGAFGLGL